MFRLETQAELDDAVARLAAKDRRLAMVVDTHGLPRLRRMPPNLESLLRIVTDQLISLKAGEAIWRRLEDRLAPFEPLTLTACTIEELMDLGLSRAKARTFHAAADALLHGRLCLHAARTHPDQEVLRQLQAIPGIGPWTSSIFLLFGLGRPDAWPTGDLALQIAAMDLAGTTGRPGAAEMEALARPWQPLRGAAAHLLWSHYRGLKGIPQSGS
ncbi:MAG: DNA-3-methyladenine glycosylase 2 family protein [Alphaproteobacteria bacterium]|nr:DNA-3-methyladenine glycosylase 2 family protein [Alphaproteobacteria bacterium]